MTGSIFKNLYNMLEQVEVHGYKNIARMKAVMDALREVIGILDEEKEEEAHGDHDKQRENI